MSDQRHPLKAAMVVAALCCGAPLADAQTVAEAAKLTEAQQRAIVLGFANNSITNLPQRTDRSGKIKSETEYTRDRTLANLVRALFIQDATHPNNAPEGLRAMLSRIRRYSTESPDRTVLDVMGELVDWSFRHFYTEFYTPEKQAELGRKSDADQEAWFRVNIEMYTNERLYQQTMKQMQAQKEEIEKKMHEMYDQAVILADGRHVLRTEAGDFMVISADPNDTREVRLDPAHYPEAQRIYDCMNRRGIKTGEEGRAQCAGNQ